MHTRVLPYSPGSGRCRVYPDAGILAPFFALLFLCLALPPQARASDWGMGWEVGAITATPKGNPFVFRITVAKKYSEEFSLGPSFFLTPYGDNAMYSGSLNSQFHVQMQRLRISPFIGIGVAYRTIENDNDTALMFPMGASVDVPVGEKLYLVGTASVNLHGGITLDGEEDNASLGLTAGISYSP
jgi:hypothetical protein